MWVLRIAEGIAAIGAAIFILLQLVSLLQRSRHLRKWLPVLILLACPSLVEAACSGASPTWTAASISRTDVLDCVNAVTRGSGLSVDTINVPAGSATWTSGINVTKGVRIKGAGVGQSVVTLNGGRFIDFSPDATAKANNEFFMYSGFEVDANGATNIGNIDGTDSTASAAWSNWLITHNKFKNGSTANNGVAFLIGNPGQSWGVMSYNEFLNVNILYQYFGNDTTASGGCDVPNDVLNAAYFPRAFGLQGNGKNFYFEHNWIHFSGSYAGTDPGWTETGHGSGEVIRYNFYDFSGAANGQEIWDVHGQQGFNPTCLGGASSTIIAEIYGNIVVNSNLKFRALNHRGMWGLYFNNIIGGSGGNSFDITQYDWGCQAKAYTSPAGKPNGEIHHTYLFNNTLAGSQIDGLLQPAGGTGSGAFNHTAPTGCPPIENSQFYNQASNTVNASPCTNLACTQGVGRGTVTPTGTCTAGTAYWKASTASPLTGVDGSGFLSQANIDIIQNATLYLCDTTNDNWQVHFTAYTDPHPLNAQYSGGSPSSNTGYQSFPTMRMMRLFEVAAAICGIGWHFRRAILASAVATMTVAQTATMTLPDYSARTYQASRDLAAKAILFVLQKEGRS